MPRFDIDRRLLNSIALLVLAVIVFYLAQTGALRGVVGLAAAPFAPLQAWISGQFGVVNDLTEDGPTLAELEAENAALRAELNALEAQVLSLQEAAAERDRLAAILDYARTFPEPDYLAADVIGRDSSPLLNFFILSRGSASGVFRDMPVVAAEGLVGIITEVTPTTSKVLVITDPSMAVNVRLQDTRAEGVLQGTGTNALSLQFIQQDIALGENELVLTSGLGGTYPPNIPVGVVASTQQRTFDLFQTADVRPRVDFDQLETVLIITNFDAPNIAPLLGTPQPSP